MRDNKIAFILFIVLVFILFIVLLLSGCRSQASILDNHINPDDVSQIQAVLAMGNPEYGARSKIITDRNEIESIVNAFNEVTIGDEVNDDDFHVALPSRYNFFTGETIAYQFSFNGNDTERIWIARNLHWAYYANQSPFELYQESFATEIIVDENLIEIQQP